MRLKYLISSLLPVSLLLGNTWLGLGGTGTGNWNVAGNWSSGVPNSVGASVLFNSAFVNPTVTLDINAIVGTITFNSSAVTTYQITGANTLTLNNSSTPASIISQASNLATVVISTPLVLASNLTVDLDNMNSLTLSGVISGGGSLTLTGPGTQPLILSAVNTYSGGTIISSGTLQCDIAQALPSTGGVTVNGTLNLNNNAQTVTALNGSGSVTLGSATLTVTTNGASSFGGNISGSGGLIVGGTGSLTLTNTNGYNGGTTVSGGSLILGVSNSLNSAGALTVNSPGIFNLNNFSQTVASLAGTGSVALGSGTLQIAGSTPTTFSGVISGTGSLIYSGSATTTFSGANTYTGGTTISGAGTLQLGRSNALPPGGNITMTNGALDLNNFSQTTGTFSATAGSVTLGSGQLIVAPTGNASFAAVISGSGSLVFQGPATWTLTASQNYTGPTTINGGILQMGVAGGLNSSTDTTVNAPGTLALNNNPLTIRSLAGSGTVALGSGTLTLNTVATTTFSGVIQGTGALMVSGTGTEILTGGSTYSGGTTITANATLEGTTTSLQGAIVNNGTLFFAQGFSGQYNGPLSGTGLLQIGGGGTVTLTGTPSQGIVSVSGGHLNIATGANLIAPVVTIGANSTLSGSGAITGSVSNSGIIDPTQTLIVNGNVTFLPGSSFTADVTPSTADQLNVSGNVTIQGGSTITINVTPGNYPAQSQYLIVKAGGGPVSGQFQGFNVANPFLQAQLLYNQVTPGSVQLEILVRSFSDVIQGGNAGAFSECLSQANFMNNPDLQFLASSLIFFSVDRVREILDQMQPSQLRTQTVAEQTNALFAIQTLRTRLSQLSRTKCENKINSTHPWNLWTSLAGNWTEQRHADHNVGYRAPQGAFTFGFDGKIGKDLNLGVALEYGYTALTWENFQGSSAINQLSGGPYVGYGGKYGFLNAILLASFTHFSTERKIPFFDREAESTHVSGVFLPHIDGGFIVYPIPSVSFSPFASVDFLFDWENGYEETGAGSLDFIIDSSSAMLIRSEVGLRIAKCATRSHSKWIHEIKASWVREDRLYGGRLNATFKQFPCSFSVDGLYPSRSFLDVGLGLSYIFNRDTFATTLKYDGQFGDAVSIQSGIAQLLVRF